MKKATVPAYPRAPGLLLLCECFPCSDTGEYQDAYDACPLDYLVAHP